MGGGHRSCAGAAVIGGEPTGAAAIGQPQTVASTSIFGRARNGYSPLIQGRSAFVSDVSPTSPDSRATTFLMTASIATVGAIGRQGGLRNSGWSGKVDNLAKPQSITGNGRIQALSAIGVPFHTRDRAPRPAGCAGPRHYLPAVYCPIHARVVPARPEPVRRRET